MPVGVSNSPPDKEDRERKHRRLGDNPGKTEAFAAEPRVDYANEQGTDDAAIG
jgi:hypothetical protein